ncbi:Translation machinery-associated protein 17 [Nakaseomyces bracarensis]|uniref:Translation machinery-associated protein 17 n=1 Tax=Nakaseomyces bracarensis TaxID=273131 RepID=A0ABR4NM96_9SACH
MATASGMKRPVDVASFKVAISDMGSDELNRIKHELENSIRHLSRSNERLHNYIKKLKGEDVEIDGEEMDEGLGSDDIELFQDSIRENELVLENSQERLEALEDELSYRSQPTTKEATYDSLGERKPSAIDMDNSKVDVAAPNSIYL